MGSPAIYAGSRTKLLTSKGLLLKSGMPIDYNGVKNYITRGSFATASTVGWSLKRTTLTNLIPDQVAASWTTPSVLTLSATQTGALTQSGYTMSLAASGATTAGDMLVTDQYALDLEDQAKTLSFKFSYQAYANGANLNFSGTSANTFHVYIYDSTNDVWIQPTGCYTMVQGSGVGIGYGTFQTPSNMASFRLAFVSANASAGAFTLYLDNISVGPVPVTDSVIAGPSLMGNPSDSPAYPSAIPLSNLKSMLGLLGLDFSKTDRFTPVFEKTAAETLNLKAGTSVFVNGKTISFPSATPVTMPSFSGKVGTDFAIFVCDDGVVIADENFSAPTGYDPEEAKLIGGFHYGLVGPTETVAGGSFASSGNGYHWDQPAVNLIRGINVYSIWDLKFRPACDDPRGMALVANSFWADIYLCNTNPAVNGTSKYNSDVASGTVLPKIPAAFGGDGSASYANLNWWTANEIVKGYGKRLMSNAEFCAAAFGVTESQSIGTGAVSTTTGQALGSGSNTIAFTGRVAGYTSRWGLEQASGNQYTWGSDASYRYDGTQNFNWQNVNGGRGQVYTEGTYGLVYVILGGDRVIAANSGSRCSDWSIYPWVSYWSVGVRAACDPLKLG